VWESGWQRGSAPAGSSYSTLINPSARGARFILYLETHNGTIASTSELTAFYIPPSPDILEGLVSRQNLELEVYDGITGDFIDVVTEATGIQYLDELRGPGGGSFDIRLDDPSWTRSPTLINPRNVVRVKDHGAYIGFWVITGHEPKVVQAGEAAAEGITVKGVGGYGIWPGDALLFPRTGKADFSSHLNLIPNQRSFGVASHVEDGSWYDVTTWNNATQECRQDNVIDPSIGNGNPWRGSPSSWPSDLTTAYWMWSADYRDYALPGTLVFKQAFNNLETVPIGCQFFIAADDEAQVYLDGAPWVTATDWHDTTQSEVVFVSPGYHEVTIIAAVGTYDNSAINYWKNPAGILCGMYVLGTGNAAAAHNVYLKSGSSWLVTGYGPLPTMTIGDILTQLYNEAADRGVTSFNNFDIGFDDVNDSYGLPWSKDGTQWLFDVFTQYDQIFDKLTDTACEIWFDAQLRLQASRQRGANRALTAPINTYFEIVQNAGPSVFYDFQEAMVTVSIPSAGITTKGFPTVTGSSVGFPLVNGASQTALGYKTIINDSPGSLLQEPATEIHGVVTDSTYLSTNGGQDIFFYGADWMSGDPGADVLMHLSSQDGMTFEWLQSDSIFSMDFRLFSGDDAPTWATVGASAVHVFNVACTDDNPNHFNQAKIVLSDGGQPGDPDVFVVAWVLMDNLTHHWAVNYFNQGQDGYIVVYRDGIELLTASYPINFVAGGLVVTYHASKGPSYNQKLSPGLGAVALYDRVLTEDEIYDHYLAIQNVVYGSLTNTLGGQGISRIEPVIFRKAKNVVNSSATIDHAAKTSLIARTLEGATQIDATLSARNRVGRIEGYYDGSSKRTQDARRVASQAMTASLIAQTSNTLDITGDYVPWRDFGVGDWVLAPGDYNEELIKRRVVSISVSQDPDTGRSVYALEVDSLNNENAQRVALWLNRTLPQGSLSGLIADSG
jgi:hypothetical protein